MGSSATHHDLPTTEHRHRTGKCAALTTSPRSSRNSGARQDDMALICGTHFDPRELCGFFAFSGPGCALR